MWNTSIGKRTLKNAEAALFAEALHTLVDDSSVWDFEDYFMGVQAFDSLTSGQKVSALWTIAKGLLKEDVEPIRHTAALEGTIAAVFKQIEDKVTVELEDAESRCNWRKLVIAARKASQAEDVISLECNDFDAWQFEIEQIEDNILWDNDFDTCNLYMDLPPEEAKAMKELIGISDAYTLTIPNDLNQEHMEKTIAEIRKLCSRFVP